MTIERTFLFSLLVGTGREDDHGDDRMRQALRHGVSEEAFADPDYRNVWRFVEGHFSRYGALPSLEVTEIECDVRFPDYAPEEPFGFWLEQLRLFQKHVFMADAVEHIQEELNAGRTHQAEELVARTHHGLVGYDIATNAFTLQELTDEAIRQHDEIQRHRQEPGIPVGLPYLNTVTGGAQPGDIWVIAGRPASGKCLGKGTPVLMYDGTIKKVEDVKVGDLLMGPDSRPRTVQSLVRGREEMFRVIPKRGGDPYVVNRSHILSLRMSGTEKIVNISVEDYFNSSGKFKHHAKGWKAPGVDFGGEKQELPIPPYILGVWLGDGTSAVPNITTMDQEVVNELSDYAQSIGLFCLPLNSSAHGRADTWTISNGYDWQGKKNRFRDALRALDLFGNKHVPHVYKVASREDRLELLAGFLDADGSSSNGYSFDVVQKNKRLIDDMAFLARSLGFLASVKPCEKTCTNNSSKGRYYRMYIGGCVAQVPSRLERRRVLKSGRKNVLNTGFEIESVGEDDYYGFEIDGPDRLFLLGDFTVTHNSFLVSRVAMGAWTLEKRVLVISMEMAAIQFGRRNASMGAGVTSKFLRLGRLSAFAVERLREFLQEVRGRGNPESFTVVEGRLNLSVRDVVSYIRQYSPDMVIVDGAYMLKPAGGGYKSNWENTLQVTNELKQVAQNTAVPIITTHQFNRKGDKDKSLGNIAYADTIGQIASVVLSLADEQANQSTYAPVIYKVMEILKGREGETGQIRIRCDMRVTSIEEAEVLIGDDSLIDPPGERDEEPDEDSEWELSGTDG